MSSASEWKTQCASETEESEDRMDRDVLKQSIGMIASLLLNNKQVGISMQAPSPRHRLPDRFIHIVIPS